MSTVPDSILKFKKGIELEFKNYHKKQVIPPLDDPNRLLSTEKSYKLENIIYLENLTVFQLENEKGYFNSVHFEVKK
jgi:hypothetical protein